MSVPLELLRAVVAATPHDVWLGLDLVEAAEGHAFVRLASRPDLLQQSGFLHAGVIAALIDRAAGFAAASVAGAVLTANFQVTPYRPAVGDTFEAVANQLSIGHYSSKAGINGTQKRNRTGKMQVFVNVELFAIMGDDRKLAAGGTAVLAVTG